MTRRSMPFTLTQLPVVTKVSLLIIVDRNGRCTHTIPGTRMCGVFKPTKVISASYGQAERDLPINYSKRQCNE